MSTDLILRKDTAFFMRLNGHVKKAMDATAKKKGLSTAAFLDGIIKDALKKEGVTIKLSKTII